MKKGSKEEKITIQGAAKTLGVSRGTVVHYLNNGRLTRIKDGSKVYILMNEIKALRGRKEDRNAASSVGEPQGSDGITVIKDGEHSVGEPRGSDGITLTIDREHYEELLSRLGQLELEKEQLLEYKNSMVDTKAALIQREKGLQEAEAKLFMMEEELRRIKKMGWWRRLFGRGWRMTGG
jgi:excisionase family DNA binding protein